MKVVAVRTPGSVLSALEIRGDLSMVERRSSTMGSGLSVAVASARSEIVLSSRPHGDQPATIVTAPTDNPTSLDGQILAIGTSRFEAVEVDGDRLWMKPIRPGVVQAGDVVRVIPRELLGSDDFFPRIPDGLPNAWDSEEPRYSAGYEKRAELIWDAMTDLGFFPTIEWAGSEDGEAIVARGKDSKALLIVDLEDPEQQKTMDLLIAEAGLAFWIREQIAHLNGTGE